MVDNVIGSNKKYSSCYDDLTSVSITKRSSSLSELTMDCSTSCCEGIFFHSVDDENKLLNEETLRNWSRNSNFKKLNGNWHSIDCDMSVQLGV